MSFLNECCRVVMAQVNLGGPHPSDTSWICALPYLREMFTDTVIHLDNGDQVRAHRCILAAAGNAFLREVLLQHQTEEAGFIFDHSLFAASNVIKVCVVLPFHKFFLDILQYIAFSHFLVKSQKIFAILEPKWSKIKPVNRTCTCCLPAGPQLTCPKS